MKPLGDRRLRVRFEVVGTLRGTLEVSETARVVDISRGGALLETSSAMPLGSIQTINLSVNGRQTHLSARIQRLSRIEGAEPGRYAVGVEFLSPSARAAETIAHLIAEAQAS